MPARLEIMLQPDLLDAEGESVRRAAREYFGLEFSGSGSSRFSPLTPI